MSYCVFSFLALLYPVHFLVFVIACVLIIRLCFSSISFLVSHFTLYFFIFHVIPFLTFTFYFCLLVSLFTFAFGRHISCPVLYIPYIRYSRHTSSPLLFLYTFFIFLMALYILHCPFFLISSFSFLYIPVPFLYFLYVHLPYLYSSSYFLPLYVLYSAFCLIFLHFPLYFLYITSYFFDI